MPAYQTSVDSWSKRHQSLKDHFHRALKKALATTTEDEFRRCFPGFEERQVAAFYECYRQVLFQVRSNSEAEFEVICEEAQLASKFAAMDQMAREQGLIDHSADEGAQMTGTMPAHRVLTRRVLAKQREAQELAAILQKAKESQDLCSREADAKQAQLQQKADAFKPIAQAVSKVHEASKIWNGRSAAV